MNTQSKEELFSTVPIPRALATMAVPTIISQLINLIYNVVDTFFIGRTGNSYMVASVTVSFSVFMMTIAMGNLFGIGGGSLLARLMGQNRREDACRVCAFSFYGAIVISLVYSLLVGVFLTPLLQLLGASEATAGYARQYLWMTVILGTLPVVLSAVCGHLLRNAGYARQASIGLSGGGLLNIALDPLFMFVLLPSGWEVFGAALATFLSNVAACVYMLVMMGKVSRVAPLSMRLGQARAVRREDRKEIFAVGVPSALLNALFDVANVFLNALMAAHGDLPLAAIGIVMKAERLPNAVNVGISQGMLPIVAYNYTAGNRERMENVIRYARRCGLLISLASIVFFQLCASPIARLFMSVSGSHAQQALETIAYATTFLRIRSLASPVQFMNFHTSFCLQAMGDGRDTLLHSVVRQMVFYIPFMFLLDRFFGVTGLASAVIAGESCSALFALVLLRRWLRKLERADDPG